MTLAFRDTTVPQVTTKGPNPFTELFGKDGLPEGKAKAVTLDVAPEHPKGETYKGGKPKPHPEIAKLTNQAREAAEKIGKTARVKVEPAQGSTKAKPRTDLTVWTIKRVSRPGSGPSKPADADKPDDKPADK